MDRLGSALDNLALAATNDKTVLEQLTAANLALTGTIATLTATNKKPGRQGSFRHGWHSEDSWHAG
jgi:hypothetical protein